MADQSAPPFVRGQLYSRSRDIHERYKGSARSGISPTKNFPFVFLFTGEAGETYGYEDTWRDGLFLYSGEGQVGDQLMTKGNKAILDHAKNQKELLLFTKVKTGQVRFEGYFHCVGWETKRGKDRESNIRNIIVFHLKPEDAVSGEIDVYDVKNSTTSGSASSLSLEELRIRAFEAANRPEKKTVRESSRNYYERSGAVRAYVLKRANGICECCGSEAPFKNKIGEPYLEAHHIRRLSDRGLDDPIHVAGICPTCHRRIHHGVDGARIDEQLLTKIQKIESPA